MAGGAVSPMKGACGFAFRVTEQRPPWRGTRGPGSRPQSHGGSGPAAPRWPVGGRPCAPMDGPGSPARRSEDGPVTQPAPEHDEYESWQDLQAVLEERDREYWEGAGSEGPDGQ